MWWWLLTALSVAKIPVVKWGQKSSHLYLTVLIREPEEPQVTITEKRVSISATSGGEPYDIEMHLLRPINVTASSYTIETWRIKLELQKERTEPCWLRLMKSKKVKTPWLKHDYDTWDPQDCQYFKEMWREGYFKQQLAEKDGRRPAASGEEDDSAIQRSKWDEVVNKMRKKAIKNKK
eukprot:GEMP01113457.1.p1 GENE.GEMP01113457.1~~GEMP01113457.1.p1  ORF type:complete len:178 (+),score=36.94 GEMP01113457.1:54-587(+)